MSKLKVILYSCDMGIRAKIRKAFKGEGYEVIEVTDGSKFAREGINEQQQQHALSRLTLLRYASPSGRTTGSLDQYQQAGEKEEVSDFMERFMQNLDEIGDEVLP